MSFVNKIMYLDLDFSYKKIVCIKVLRAKINGQKK
jgi:hypothetical protein